jgi:branched-chain amino acid transport system permease protein
MEQQLFNGLFIGSIYALFAVGYTLVFGILDILNIAHQAVFMLGAVVALELVLLTGMNIWLAMLLAFLFCGVIGILLDRIAFRPLRKRPDTYFSSLISSIAMGLIFEAIVLRGFGPDPRRFPFGTFPVEIFEVGDVVITLRQLVIVALALAFSLGLQLFIKRTRTGRAIRTVAENPRAAGLLGVNVNGIIALCFFISSALGGVAGVLYALEYNNIAPEMGRAIELKGLAVIILGGMGSIPGAVLGGLLLGLTEVFTIQVLGPQGSSLKDAVAFTVLFLILVVRPRGLLGQKAVREA